MFHVQLVVCFVAIVATWICHWAYKWMNPRCSGKLPPGSMGFPIIGETIEYFAPEGLHGIPSFIQKRVVKYGPVFRTSLIGQKVIVSTDPEINYSIFQQEGKSFVLWYSENFIKILGEQSLAAYHGMVHKYLKNLILHLIGPENLRLKLVHEIDSATCMYLQPWPAHATVNIKEESSNMVFKYFAKKLISYQEPEALKKLKDNYMAFLDGLISFPLNIRGTAYHASLQGRKNVVKVIKDIIRERKESKMRENDFLDHLVDEAEKEETILTESSIVDLVFVLLFIACETTSSFITLAIKFISDHPKVLAELTKEHETIIKKRDDKDSGITWQEYKSMTFTHMVINETARLANLAPGISRKVVKDVDIKGYRIPAGWVVMTVPSAVHLNPDKFEDPLAFNPWRWEGKELHAGSKSFMAFGGGVRLCVGADFAKLQMSIFLHHLVTKYRWTVVGGNVIRRPCVVFPGGFHIHVKEKKNKSMDEEETRIA